MKRSNVLAKVSQGDIVGNLGRLLHFRTLRRNTLWVLSIAFVLVNSYFTLSKFGHVPHVKQWIRISFDVFFLVAMGSCLLLERIFVRRYIEVISSATSSTDKRLLGYLLQGLVDSGRSKKASDHLINRACVRALIEVFPRVTDEDLQTPHVRTIVSLKSLLTSEIISNTAHPEARMMVLAIIEAAKRLELIELFPEIKTISELLPKDTAQKALRNQALKCRDVLKEAIDKQQSSGNLLRSMDHQPTSDQLLKPITSQDTDPNQLLRPK